MYTYIYIYVYKCLYILYYIYTYIYVYTCIENTSYQLDPTMVLDYLRSAPRGPWGLEWLGAAVPTAQRRHARPESQGYHRPPTARDQP